jgi:hypothetical protein
MNLRTFAGWRGVVVGVVAMVLGAWAVMYTCNTETAACKGVVPWPGTAGFMNKVGWFLVVAGIVVIVVAVIAWISRVAGGRAKAV